MTEYADLTRLVDVRSRYLGSAQTTDDVLLAEIIQQVSKEIRGIANRRFYPVVRVRYYDTPIGPNLLLDDDLLAVTALTNGDGSTIDAADYKLYPLSDTPKQKVYLLPTSVIWQTTSTGYGNGAISLSGIWGYHDDYPAAWSSAGTLTSAINDSVTSITLTAGSAYQGELLKIDNEILYVPSGAVSPVSSPTVVRGCNGSVAASHSQGAAVSRWSAVDEIGGLAAQAAAMYYRLRSNPSMDSYSMDGVTFSTPKDIMKYVRSRVENMGLVRLGFA